MYKVKFTGIYQDFSIRWLSDKTFSGCSYMVKCPQCLSFNINKLGVQTCMECGKTIEFTADHIKVVKSRQTKLDVVLDVAFECCLKDNDTLSEDQEYFIWQVYKRLIHTL
jgi:hypothetical protein